MSFTIYGIRLIGSKEARYIGQTERAPDTRLAGLIAEARLMPSRTQFAKWLLANAAEIEAFEIATAATRDDARRVERETIMTCLALNHELYNQWLVPTHRRIATRPLQDKAA